jgi:hypothetical protein
LLTKGEDLLRTNRNLKVPPLDLKPRLLNATFMMPTIKEILSRETENWTSWTKLLPLLPPDFKVLPISWKSETDLPIDFYNHDIRH